MRDTNLLDARAAGQLLCMIPAKVLYLAEHGMLPCIALPNGDIRFDTVDLRNWIEDRRQRHNWLASLPSAVRDILSDTAGECPDGGEVEADELPESPAFNKGKASGLT